VLTAIGLPADEARSSLRFSLGRQTTAAEIDFALEIIPAAVKRLRAFSPPYVGTQGGEISTQASVTGGRIDFLSTDNKA
jgi:cysteine desulfurase